MKKNLNANISNNSNTHNPTNRGTNKRSVHNTKQHKNMSNRVTKAVTMLSSIHDVKSSVRNVFYSQKHFPKVLGSSMLCAFVGTYCMMESIHQGRLREQEKQYSEAWEVYSEEKQRHNEQYETALSPTLRQKRRLTKSESVVFLSPTNIHRPDESVDRVRLSNE